ncbi:MAG: hypothetical protein HY810_00295 [Candidatus Omnitrophica bacterium]|nr:hypothetical protein [Candidatus Omnitrophota bacterium]
MKTSNLRKKIWFKVISLSMMQLFMLNSIVFAFDFQDSAYKNDNRNDYRDKFNSQVAMLNIPANSVIPMSKESTARDINDVSDVDYNLIIENLKGCDLKTKCAILKTVGCSELQAATRLTEKGYKADDVAKSLKEEGFDQEKVADAIETIIKKERNFSSQENVSKNTLKTSAEEEKGSEKEESEEYVEQGLALEKDKKERLEVNRQIDFIIEKEAERIIEKTIRDDALQRQVIEVVKLMLNEGKRGVVLFEVLKKSGFSNEKIISALLSVGVDLKEIISMFKQANISCEDIVKALFSSQSSYSAKEIYAALIACGYDDEEIISAFRISGIAANEILKISSELGRDMINVAKAMIKAGFSYTQIAKAYLLKAMKWTWDKSVDIINCAVKAFDAFITNISRKISSKEDLAYTLIVEDILNAGKVVIEDQNVMTSMFAIKKVANDFGVNLDGYNIGLETLKELENGAIINLDNNHWVTFAGVEKDMVTIIDNGEKKQISLFELKMRWDSNALLVNKNKSGLKNINDLKMRQIRGGRSANNAWKAIQREVGRERKDLTKPVDEYTGEAEELLGVDEYRGSSNFFAQMYVDGFDANVAMGEMNSGITATESTALATEGQFTDAFTNAAETPDEYSSAPATDELIEKVDGISEDIAEALNIDEYRSSSNFFAKLHVSSYDAVDMFVDGEVNYMKSMALAGEGKWEESWDTLCVAQYQFNGNASQVWMGLMSEDDAREVGKVVKPIITAVCTIIGGYLGGDEGAAIGAFVGTLCSSMFDYDMQQMAKNNNNVDGFNKGLGIYAKYAVISAAAAYCSSWLGGELGDWWSGGSEAAGGTAGGTTGGTAGGGATGGAVGGGTTSVGTSAGTGQVISAAVQQAVKQSLSSYVLTYGLDKAGVDDPYLRAAIIGIVGAYSGSQGWGVDTQSMVEGCLSNVAMEGIRELGEDQGWDPAITESLAAIVGTIVTSAVDAGFDTYAASNNNVTETGTDSAVTDSTEDESEPPAGGDIVLTDSTGTVNTFTNSFSNNMKNSAGDLCAKIASNIVVAVAEKNGAGPEVTQMLSYVAKSLTKDAVNAGLSENEKFTWSDVGKAAKEGQSALIVTGMRNYLVDQCGMTEEDATAVIYSAMVSADMSATNNNIGNENSNSLGLTLTNNLNSLVNGPGYEGNAYDRASYTNTFNTNAENLDNSVNNNGNSFISAYSNLKSEEVKGRQMSYSIETFDTMINAAETGVKQHLAKKQAEKQNIELAHNSLTGQQLIETFKNEEPGLHVYGDMDNNKPTMLLIHGAGGEPADFAFFVDTYQGEYNIVFYTYSQKDDLDQTSSNLIAEWGTFTSENGVENTVVVEHSFGQTVFRNAVINDGTGVFNNADSIALTPIYGGDAGAEGSSTGVAGVVTGVAGYGNTVNAVDPLGEKSQSLYSSNNLNLFNERVGSNNVIMIQGDTHSPNNSSSETFTNNWQNAFNSANISVSLEQTTTYSHTEALVSPIAREVFDDMLRNR